jgi:hypothetical protein
MEASTIIAGSSRLVFPNRTYLSPAIFNYACKIQRLFFI